MNRCLLRNLQSVDVLWCWPVSGMTNPFRRQREDARLTVTITEIWRQPRATCGSPRALAGIPWESAVTT